MIIAFGILSTTLVTNIFFTIFYRMQLKDKEKEVMLLRKSAESHNRQTDDSQNKKRKYHRVQLYDPLPCQVHLVDFGTERLNRLKDKSFNGFIQDISLGGVCLLTEIALPVQFTITAELVFTFDEQKFTLPCKFVRKEARAGASHIKYGVQFQQLSGKEEHQLALLINRLELKNRGKSDDIHYKTI